jgi:hypothetical protein
MACGQTMKAWGREFAMDVAREWTRTYIDEAAANVSMPTRHADAQMRNATRFVMLHEGGASSGEELLVPERKISLAGRERRSIGAAYDFPGKQLSIEAFSMGAGFELAAGLWHPFGGGWQA